MTDEDIYTPVDEALAELRRRRDRGLIHQVHEALVGDVPRYLIEHECFVLSRHIATPNNEALYVLTSAERAGATAVFSQDSGDKFTSVNNLKRRLARPELHRARDTATGGAFRRVDLVDVAAAENSPLEDVVTRDGRPLVDFHNSLFARLEGRQFRVVDDRAWIDRNGRGHMQELYARYLLFFIAHGVLFEEFETPSDQHFKTDLILPLVATCKARFGVKPIIVRPHKAAAGSDERFHLAHSEDVFPISAFWRPMLASSERAPISQCAPCGARFSWSQPALVTVHGLG